MGLTFDLHNPPVCRWSVVQLLCASVFPPARWAWGFLQGRIVVRNEWDMEACGLALDLPRGTG